MKKILFASLFVLGVFATASAQNYYPNERYGQRSADEYYYYPEDNVYYNSNSNNYVYYDQNRWCSGPSLPRNFRFNNSGLRVSINYGGNSIWRLNDSHMRQYRNNNYGQFNNNNNHQRNNSYGNSYPGRNNRRYDIGRSQNQRRNGGGHRNARH